MVTGSCHCGGTKVQVSVAPSSVTSCNCTFCSKRGALWAYYDLDQVRLVADEHRARYQRPGRPVAHHHCAVCGCSTWSDSPVWVDGKPHPTQRRLLVNARLFDDFDLAAVPVRHIDGRTGW